MKPGSKSDNQLLSEAYGQTTMHPEGVATTFYMAFVGWMLYKHGWKKVVNWVTHNLMGGDRESSKDMYGDHRPGGKDRPGSWFKDSNEVADTPVVENSHYDLNEQILKFLLQAFPKKDPDDMRKVADKVVEEYGDKLRSLIDKNLPSHAASLAATKSDPGKSDHRWDSDSPRERSRREMERGQTPSRFGSTGDDARDFD